MEIPGILRITEPAGPQAPLLLGVPHSGRVYPGDFKYVCPQLYLQQAEDSFVDILVEGASKHGATLLTALFPRTFVDANRNTDDIDPAVIEGTWPEPLAPSDRTLQGLGMIRRLCRNGTPIYDAPLPHAEIEQRIRQFYTPYHNAMKRQLEQLHRRFDEIWLVDCHSMPSRGDVSAGMRADFVLGDLDGRSCDPEFMTLSARLLRDLGYKVAINDPYKGVEILRRYGQPEHKQHALQLEINRELYLNEATCERSAGFDKLQADLDTFFVRLIAALSHKHSDHLAAE